MTTKDLELIRQARKTPCHRWSEIGLRLMPQAETEEAREELRDIEKSKYHYDEYYAGIL